MSTKQYVLWGVGNHLRCNLNLNVALRCDYFVDLDKSKQTELFLGKQVFSPNILMEADKENTIVIITSHKYYREIATILDDFGFIEGHTYFLEKYFAGDDDFPPLHKVLSWNEMADDFFNCLDNANRSKCVAKLIDFNNNDRILDLGAGKMWLKEYIPTDVEYVPCDFEKTTAEVLQCDFDKHQFPTFDSKFDIVILVGVLGWLEDPLWLLTKAIESLRQGGQLIVLANQVELDEVRLPLSRAFVEWTNLVPCLNNMQMKITKTQMMNEKSVLIKCLKY